MEHKAEKAVFALLTEKGMTLAAAESCTGGLLAERMTDLPGASKVFVGGVVPAIETSFGITVTAWVVVTLRPPSVYRIVTLVMPSDRGPLGSMA